MRTGRMQRARGGFWPRVLGLLKDAKVRSWQDVMENDRGNSHSGSGAGERTTRVVNALTERAPMARKVREALRNMMMWSVARKSR